MTCQPGGGHHKITPLAHYQVLVLQTVNFVNFVNFSILQSIENHLQGLQVESESSVSGKVLLKMKCHKKH